MAGGAVLVSREGVNTGVNTSNASIWDLAGAWAEPIIVCVDDMRACLAELAFTDPMATPGTDVRCDRCGFHAATEFAVGTGEIALCGHHTHQHIRALSEMGASPRSADTDRLWFLDLPDPTGA